MHAAWRVMDEHAPVARTVHVVLPDSGRSLCGYEEEWPGPAGATASPCPECTALLRSGQVDFAGVQKRVNLSYVPEAKVGDYVLVHVGFAISTVDQAEAAQVFEYLRAMGDLEELNAADGSAGAKPPQ